MTSQIQHNCWRADDLLQAEDPQTRNAAAPGERFKLGLRKRGLNKAIEWLVLRVASS